MANQATTVTVKAHRKADQYNDPDYNYLHYWDGREYEHAAEQLAIQRLLRNKHFDRALDIGGGYGRLCLLLERYADKVILAEPSKKQLDLAQDFLKGHPDIERKLVTADDLQMPDESVDLVTMIRVMHHLPDPTAELNEIARVLKDDGCAIIEMANYSHFRNRLKYLMRGRRLPIKPVDIRSPEHHKEGEIPFVNHNPHTVSRQLIHAGLRVERVLSVSNLRSPWLKQHASLNFMTKVEKVLQPILAPLYFGPSIFFLVRKAD
jgi:SAM-dependent methyltransferase